MASHNRHRSRGSISILDQIRSLSRAGSRQEHVRSTSSMSCDPHRQPVSSPGPVLPAVSSVLAAGSMVKSSTTALPHFPSTQFETPPPPYENKSRTRPRSWLSFPRPKMRQPSRSQSVHLPKESSRSTMGRSVISAPVLTSTTNVRVAQDEGLPCEGLDDLRQPMWEQTMPQQGQKSTRLSGIINLMKRKKPELEENRMSAFENGIARRHAEAVNLCREKINKLTGHGHVKRKSVNDIVGDAPLLNTREASFVGISDQSSEFGVGSLTRSFASAVDKLNFQIEPTMGIQRSRTSFFNLVKRDKEDNAGTGPGKPVSSVKEELTGKSDEPKLTLKELLAEARSEHKPQPQLGATDPEPLQFDATQNAYRPVRPVDKYPRGVNPLRMHTSPMEFATAPPGMTWPKPRETDDFKSMDEDDQIENAPIYSPSSGDLRQYAQSPSSSTTIVKSEEEQDTPTHPPQRSYMRRLGLKKSESGLERLGRKKTEVTEDKAVKKSRSMHFGLFKRDEPDPMPSSFQPTTPSPLRNIVNRPESERHLRSPPRNVTPSERIKRHGIVGMPSTDLDKLGLEPVIDEGDQR